MPRAKVYIQSIELYSLGLIRTGLGRADTCLENDLDFL
jgi:hypothetical protein